MECCNIFNRVCPGVASPLLVFAVIFYVGKRFGGTSSFKKIFSVLSYCLIPMIIGTASVTWYRNFYEFVFVDDYSSGKYDGLAPSYALDFALQQSMIFGLIALPFVAWSVILAIKAVKIVNNFETKRSFGIIYIVIPDSYLFMILYDISFSVIFYLRLT
ncbi:Yip1 family protein [Nitrosopumilus ureiphilus]|uniref:Yip1 domain-containing protein n=1 Tax=Nitrosopumilus ureiphilus TaxID=1470067 RepID=A0A7D5M6I4_9ARCH|nr:Yip1 family protein [Nitrosopumilus ureiphilus]QLH07171.1 hypothetical protein C5F50_08845 [Nitrosopumilus ureiphilus]